MVTKFCGVNENSSRNEKFYVFDVQVEGRPWTYFSVEIPFPGNRHQVGKYSKSVMMLPRADRSRVLTSVKGYMDTHDLRYSSQFFDFQ